MVYVLVAPSPRVIAVAHSTSERLLRILISIFGSVLVAASLSGQTIVIDSPNPADAGIVQRGAAISTEFVVKNTGSARLRITDVQPTCACMRAKFAKTIEPGGTGKIVLTVDTKAFRSAISKNAVVLSNDPTTPRIFLLVKADVRGLISAEPSESLRIQTTQGNLAGAELTLASERADFKPSGVTTTEPYLRAFVRADTEPGKWKVRVISDSTAPVGPISAAVTMKTGIPDEPEFRIPISGVILNADQGGTEAVATSAPKVPSEPPLTNDEVLKLIAADLGDEIVVAKIKTARVARLDVTTDTLLALKEKKVSKVILAAMIERAGQPDKTSATASPSASAPAAPTAPRDPCAGVELMGLYKNEIFDRSMGGGVIEWLAKIRNNNTATRIVVFTWRDSEGQQRKAQVEVAGGQIATPRVDMTQARYIAPVANLRILSCE